MLLSLELERLKAEENSYQPSDAVKQRMADKSLIALIGPSAVGKSTIAKEIIRLGGSEFSEVLSAMTRRRRSDDPAGYQTADEGFTIERALELIHARAVTNYAIHPSGNIYATLPESFPSRYNILPLLPGSVETMRKAGFEAVHMLYIVTTIEALESQLAGRVNDPSFAARVSEGCDSLRWGLEHSDEVSFIQNIYGQPEAAAQQALRTVKEPQAMAEKEKGKEMAEAMREYLMGALPGD